MSSDVSVLIRDHEDDPIFIWDTLKTSFIQQRTAPRFNAYHALLSVQNSESESLEGLINRVNEHIRIIKSFSPSSFTLDNLYDEPAVISIIRALPHSFDDVIHTISVLDKFDKQSVIQLLRNMDQMRTNLSETSTAFSGSQLHRSHSKSFLKHHSLLLPSLLPPHRLPIHRARAFALNVISALALVVLRPSAFSRRS